MPFGISLGSFVAGAVIAVIAMHLLSKRKVA